MGVASPGPVLDQAHAREALELARRGAGQAAPNPLVGALVVRDGEVVGRGTHLHASRDHAEVVALHEAGARASGATLYVSLEPCSSHGRTPPCTEAIVAAGISRVVACMAEAQSRVETFSIGFEEEAFNELPHAKLVASRFGTTHHEFIVKANAAEHMPLLAAAYEEPYADPSALPSYILARETRRHVSVALNGDGGDEGFAGYERYANLQNWNRKSTWLRRLGMRGLALAALRSPGLGPSVERRLDGIQHVLHPDPGVGYGWMMRLFSDREKLWLSHASTRHDSQASCLDRIARLMNEPASGTALVDKMLYADTLSYLPDNLLVKVDIASMAHGLEARSPLLDHRLLELAASAPAHLKCHRGSLKWLLKETFRETLPTAIFGRAKIGFGIPLNDWFRGPLLPMTQDLLVGHGARVHRYLRPEALAAAVRQHASGAFLRGRQLWALVMLELWLRQVVEVARPTP